MPNRRQFLLSSFGYLGGTFLLSDLFTPAAQARKAPRTANPLAGGFGGGPRSIFKEEWPPAILPDHVGVMDKGYLCFTDNYGRLAVVDMRKPAPGKPPFKVLASMSGLGNKVIDFAVTPYAAYGLVYRDNENREAVVNLISISLVPPTEPRIVSEMPLTRMQDAQSITAWGDLICIAGTASSGEAIASIYGAPSRRGEAKEPSYLASLSVKNPIRQVELTEKQLTILSSDSQNGRSYVDYVFLQNPGSPEVQSSVTLEGDFRVLSRFKDSVLVAGYERGSRPGKGRCLARTLSTGVNARALASITLDPLLSVESASAQKDRYVVVGRSQGKRNLISLVPDSNRALQREQVIDLKTSKDESGLPAQGTAAVIYREPLIYIASGWSGVQLLHRNKEGFALATSYTIPRLAASGLAAFRDNVVIAGSKLQLYNISRPERPMLMAAAEPETPIKVLVGAASRLLCLSKDELSMRQMQKDSLETPITKVKVQASQICFDPVESEQRCYAIKPLEKTTKITVFQVYKESLVKEKSFEVPGLFNRCQARGGQLLLSSLNDLALLNKGTTGGDMEVQTKRHFDNLAIRDMAITDNCLVMTAIDKDSRGFFLVLGKDGPEAITRGSIDLPHDGVAMACQGNRAVAVGRNTEGKDLSTIISFAQESAPQVQSTLPALEGVSSVSISGTLAILAGRGLEIVTL
ncbi:MAG: hypothetical protein J0M35_00405 [Candidatus Obscuribacter phosphatis]|uniref:Uncharacterized protein n=1 Tax=Candidatus Obscuribacter phosphatis TaxID=1906157 RepID=A0A8J7PBG5_9BACT|nr:hypothetical protein [Candidatus Obscuribacter phosphatis]